MYMPSPEGRMAEAKVECGTERRLSSAARVRLFPGLSASRGDSVCDVGVPTRIFFSSNAERTLDLWHERDFTSGTSETTSIGPIYVEQAVYLDARSEPFPKHPY